MPSIDELTNEVARKVMILFFIIDTSSSMMGNKIDSVNKAIRETIPELKEMTNADAEVRIAVLDFASGAEWQNAQPININDFRWQDLQANGLTDLGELGFLFLSGDGRFFSSAAKILTGKRMVTKNKNKKKQYDFLNIWSFP